MGLLWAVWFREMGLWMGMEAGEMGVGGRMNLEHRSENTLCRHLTKQFFVAN